MKSNPLVILAGPSGVGKTRLPFLYAETLGIKEANQTLLFVPITPAYLEPADILGYVRPLTIDEQISRNGSSPDNEGQNESDNDFVGEYVESETSLVSFLKNAEETKDSLHIVIFDEMNLSQIEHWFAPFMSIMERNADGRKLPLYSGNISLKNGDEYPPSIDIGDNVIFVGTINIDETTKHLSDRLLDRAIVIELGQCPFTDLKGLSGLRNPVEQMEIPFYKYNLLRKGSRFYAEVFSEEELAFFNELRTLLQEKAQKCISFRNLRSVGNFIANSEGIFPRELALDLAIKQIIVPKLNGSASELTFLDDATELDRLFDKYSQLSGFTNTRYAIKVKRTELEMRGYTK